MEEKLSKRILFVIGRLASAAEIMFSRETLSRKLFELERLEEGDWRLERSLKRMEKQKLIRSKIKKGEFFYVLTREGTRKLIEFKLKNFKKTAQKWDGLWRVVIFDIPEEMRLFRDLFRRAIKSLNFFPLQRSVFAYPLDCEKEVLDLINFFNAGDCVHIILAKSLGKKEDEIRSFYKNILN